MKLGSQCPKLRDMNRKRKSRALVYGRGHIFRLSQFEFVVIIGLQI